MQGATETKIYEAPGVWITNARCILENTTYATANISSVRIGLENDAGPFVLFGLISAVGALIAFFNGSSGVILGLFLGAVSIALFYASTKAKTWYVVMHTNSGEIRAIGSKDYDFIHRG
ncbi:MAG TPA: DUF6232 family protein [Xanthomonadales bacterium]|nr:DUF6232 family protein [Xanthomonadales bacterium]